MENDTYRKTKIFFKRSYSRISGQGRKTDVYINEVYPNGYHQYEIIIHVEKSIYYVYINSSPDSIPNWNCVLSCCRNCRNMTMSEEESEKSLSNTTIIYHISEYISKFSNHGIHLLKDGKTCI